MNEINNDNIKSILYDISKNIILPKYNNLNEEDVKLKNKTDFVTSVDILVEKKLKNILLDILPNSLFVGEESYFENPDILKAYDQKQYCWTVDPIDGTRNFVKGGTRFAIMIALTFKEKIIQSWIYKPLTGDFCCAKLEEGAYINDKKIFTFKDTLINNSIGSISTKYWENVYHEKIKNIKHRFKKVNSYGCIGFEYVDIANSVRNFAILSKLYPWDHIPGILLVRESGGSVLHFDNSEYNHNVQKNNLIVTNSYNLQKEIINYLGDK